MFSFLTRWKESEVHEKYILQRKIFLVRYVLLFKDINLFVHLTHIWTHLDPLSNVKSVVGFFTYNEVF